MSYATHPTAPVPGVIQRATRGRGGRVAIVLGSGLSDLARDLTGAEPVPYSAIEGMPPSAVAGHQGALYVGEVEGTRALVFAGRAHLYEGHPPEAVTYAVRAAIGAGCTTVILTNAAGGIGDHLELGAPALISDHLNLTGMNPFIGANDDIGPRFLDLTDAYDAGLRDLALSVDPDLRSGVYAGLLGPTYETPAEVRMLKTLGADLVGMSTVLETTAARYLGARVLGVSVVTNRAAGLSDQPITHEEVAEAGRAAAARLQTLLRGILREL